MDAVQSRYIAVISVPEIGTNTALLARRRYKVRLVNSMSDHDIISIVLLYAISCHTIMYRNSIVYNLYLKILLGFICGSIIHFSHKACIS